MSALQSLAAIFIVLFVLCLFVVAAIDHALGYRSRQLRYRRRIAEEQALAEARMQMTTVATMHRMVDEARRTQFRR